MSTVKLKEKRLHPRVEQQLPLHVCINGYKFETATRNVSCIGAYCHIEKYMPPFTKVLVKLALPGNTVECHGVIVRSEDAPDGGFNIAIFFNAISEVQKRKISQYVGRFLPKDLPL